MRIYIFIIAAGILFFLSGCAGIKPVIAERSAIKHDPVHFFVGHTSSSGVVENRGGKPKIRITTKTEGIMKDGVLHLEQDLFPEGGKANHRSWKLRRVDDHHLNATANDIVGTAQGLLNGNEFSWSFRRKLPNRKFIKHVRMSQNMYLMPDGQTMIVRSVLRKFGFVVAQITEQFRKTD